MGQEERNDKQSERSSRFLVKKKENIASDTEDISRQFKGALH